MCASVAKVATSTGVPPSPPSKWWYWNWNVKERLTDSSAYTYILYRLIVISQLLFLDLFLKYRLMMYFLTTASVVNMDHRNNDAWNAFMLTLNMTIMARIFSGKLITVPITVSLIASRHACVSLNIYTSNVTVNMDTLGLFIKEIFLSGNYVVV